MSPAHTRSALWLPTPQALLILLIGVLAMSIPSSAQFARSSDSFNQNIQFNQGGANNFNSYGGGMGTRGGNGYAQPTINQQARGRGRRMLRQPAPLAPTADT
ncbi:MAG: hypothetical protein WDW36_006039 [Sanguina aurantia]